MGDQRDLADADMRAQEVQETELDVEPRELGEGLRTVPLGQAKVLDRETAREQVEIDVLDRGGAARLLREPVHGHAPEDLGQDAEAHHHQDDDDEGEERELTGATHPVCPTRVVTHAGPWSQQNPGRSVNVDGRRGTAQAAPPRAQARALPSTRRR